MSTETRIPAPGDWTPPRTYRNPKGEAERIVIWGDHGRRVVAECRPRNAEDDTVASREFAVIAAAPGMLAALRAILPYAESRLEDMEEDCELRGEDDELRKARAAYEAACAAIAAAEGRA